MKAALGNYFNSSESQQQRESVSASEGLAEQKEEAEDEGVEPETEPKEQVKFKKSPVHEQYQPTQPLVASFVLNQVCSLVVRTKMCRYYHFFFLKPFHNVC